MPLIVMTSTAKVRGTARRFGNYRNVAVVEVLPEYVGKPPAMISERARGVVRIVAHFGPQSVGKTERCQYRRALTEAASAASAN